jgi:hypothetical protein
VNLQGEHCSFGETQVCDCPLVRPLFSVLPAKAGMHLNHFTARRNATPMFSPCRSKGATQRAEKNKKRTRHGLSAVPTASIAAVLNRQHRSSTFLQAICFLCVFTLVPRESELTDPDILKVPVARATKNRSRCRGQNRLPGIIPPTVLGYMRSSEGSARTILSILREQNCVGSLRTGKFGT